MRRLPSLIAIIFAVCGSARADVIAAVPVELDIVEFNSDFSDPNDVLEPSFAISDKPAPFPSGPLWEPPNLLFEGLTARPGDVGKSWTVTAESDSDFPAAAALLTNGANDHFFKRRVVYWKDGSVTGKTIGTTGVRESTLFESLGMTDLAGYRIESITQRLDSYSITNGYVEPRTGEVGRLYDAQVTLIFEGTRVPEPGFLAIALSTLTLLGRRRRIGK